MTYERNQSLTQQVVSASPVGVCKQIRTRLDQCGSHNQMKQLLVLFATANKWEQEKRTYCTVSLPQVEATWLLCKPVWTRNTRHVQAQSHRSMVRTRLSWRLYRALCGIIRY